MAQQLSRRRPGRAAVLRRSSGYPRGGAGGKALEKGKAFLEAQRAGPRTIRCDDERWMDMFLTSKETTLSDEDGFDFDN